MDDPDTSLAYPSEWNYCYHASPPHPPNYEHQRVYCLSDTFSSCPFFRKEENSPLPEYIRLQVSKIPAPRARYRGN